MTAVFVIAAASLGLIIGAILGATGRHGALQAAYLAGALVEQKAHADECEACRRKPLDEALREADGCDNYGGTD
jgi:hypothetical protein